MFNKFLKLFSGKKVIKTPDVQVVTPVVSEGVLARRRESVKPNTSLERARFERAVERHTNSSSSTSMTDVLLTSVATAAVTSTVMSELRDDDTRNITPVSCFDSTSVSVDSDCSSSSSYDSSSSSSYSDCSSSSFDSGSCSW